MRAVINLLLQICTHAKLRHEQGHRILCLLTDLNTQAELQTDLLRRIAIAQEAEADGATAGLSEADRATIVAGTTSLQTSAEGLAAANSAAEPPIVESPQP